MDEPVFNDEQVKAIRCSNETVIVAAGPGSGKTHTLIGRILYKIWERKIQKERIAVMTFTNNAARVLSDRLSKHGIKLGYIGTLHGYCMRLIQNYGVALGYRAGTVSIATDQAAELLLQQVKNELRSQITDKELQARATPAAQLIWQEYEFRLKRANMVDYDGILRDGLLLLKKDSVRDVALIDELLVDERQDSSLIDNQIYWVIPASTRFFVGDPDQAIYSFRGSRPDLFIDDSKNVATVGYRPLENNYRSDISIGRCANDLIAHNKDRVDKVIKPVSKEEGLVMVKSFDHDGDEIYGVWSLIKEESAKATFSGIAVLARTNAIADKFRETLRGLGVPVSSGGRIFMPSDWPHALSVVGLLVDPANDFHAEAILRGQGVVDSTIKALKLEAAQESKWLSTVGLLPNMRPASLSDALVILGPFVSRESYQIILERVKTLPDDATLSDLLVDLWNRKDWERKKEKGDFLTVTTIHGAKGSEWDVVFMVAIEEGVFPHLSADAKEHPGADPHIAIMEEERRLCFVGVTRARHRLYLTWAKKRTAFFKTTDQRPSRFLSEMGMPQGPGPCPIGPAGATGPPGMP